jgi:hypothetical protein
MARSGRDGIRALIVPIAVGGCFAAVAYAATRPGPLPTGNLDRKARPGRLPKPRITEHPEAREPSSRARFRLTHRDPGVRFECRLDRAPWRICQTPIVFARVAAGRHTFATRALDRRGRRSAVARFRWTRLEAKDFAIVPDLSGVGALYPGKPPVALPLTVLNPNPAPIFVTSLRVSVSAETVGCASKDNLAFGKSNASSSTPLEVPAGDAVRLPTHRVSPPTIQLRDLPVNQDACKNARFPLRFTGNARG